jgi:hypothetical protein
MSSGGALYWSIEIRGCIRIGYMGQPNMLVPLITYYVSKYIKKFIIFTTSKQVKVSHIKVRILKLYRLLTSKRNIFA